MTAMPGLIHTGLWRWINRTGMERYELRRGTHGWILQGTILVMAEGFPFEARYEVVCDDLWRTRRADVALSGKSGEGAIKIVVEDGRWFVDGRCNESITGCMDIDMEWSPSTNTLPIRRLNLAVGESSGPVIAAWVRFPSLEIQPLSQEYERISQSRYRYASNGGAFVAELEVDEASLVTDYEGIWQREAAKSEL